MKTETALPTAETVDEGTRLLPAFASFRGVAKAGVLGRSTLIALLKEDSLPGFWDGDEFMIDLKALAGMINDKNGGKRMDNKEKAPTREATLARAGSDALAGGIEHNNHNTESRTAQDEYAFLTALLGRGEENALSQEKLRALLGLSELRATRQVIEKARRAGLCIVSSKRGYFLPADDPTVAETELKRFLHCQAARLRTNRASVRSAVIALEQIANRNQVELWSEGDLDG